MEIYFFDENGQYIGHRTLQVGEAVPNHATTVSVEIADGQAAYWLGDRWEVRDSL